MMARRFRWAGQCTSNQVAQACSRAVGLIQIGHKERVIIRITEAARCTSIQAPLAGSQAAHSFRTAHRAVGMEWPGARFTYTKAPLLSRILTLQTTLSVDVIPHTAAQAAAATVVDTTWPTSTAP